MPKGQTLGKPRNNKRKNAREKSKSPVANKRVKSVVMAKLPSKQTDAIESSATNRDQNEPNPENNQEKAKTDTRKIKLKT